MLNINLYLIFKILDNTQNAIYMCMHAYIKYLFHSLFYLVLRLDKYCQIKGFWAIFWR